MSLNSLASLNPWSSALVLSAALETTLSHRCCTDTSRFLMRITSCFWLKYLRWVPFLSRCNMVSRWVETSFWKDLCSSIWAVEECDCFKGRLMMSSLLWLSGGFNLKCILMKILQKNCMVKHFLVSVCFSLSFNSVYIPQKIGIHFCIVFINRHLNNKFRLYFPGLQYVAL